MYIVYDIEVFTNFFSYTDYNIHDKKVNTFTLFQNDNNLEEFKQYLLKLKGMIGFNNINYDYIILHGILTNKLKTNEDIYKESQNIINNQNKDFFNINIPEWKHIIKQLDLYRIHHFDNKAKRTS